jgi:hypothetical protein
VATSATGSTNFNAFQHPSTMPLLAVLKGVELPALQAIDFRLSSTSFGIFQP